MLLVMLWETEDLKCAITTPTGLASFDVEV